MILNDVSSLNEFGFFVVVCFLICLVTLVVSLVSILFKVPCFWLGGLGPI